jgi:hypothetical protein
MPDDQWFYTEGADRIGPIPKAELVARIFRGEILPAGMVWTPGMPEWQSAVETTELASTELESAAPPTAPAPARSTPPPLPSIDSLPYAGRAPFSAMYPPSPDLGQNSGMRMLIPVGRSPGAIAAGYLGLFSVLLAPAPVALAVSVMAIRDIQKHPKSHGMGRAVFGLIMGILGTVGLAIAILTVSFR